jgi:hypothetical protein
VYEGKTSRVVARQFSLLGCSEPPKEKPDDEGGETGCEPENQPIELEGCSTLSSYITEEDVCGPCQDECNIMYWCYYADGSQPEDGCPICADSEIAANNICQSEDFLDDETAYAQEAPCYLPYSCAGWNPASEVTINEVTGAKQLEQTFIDSLIADASPLSGCDDAYFSPWSSGPGFIVSDASSGELLYSLGFRNGDRPLEINNYPLDDLADVAAAFVALSYADPSTYTIEVSRPGVGTIYINVDAI